MSNSRLNKRLEKQTTKTFLLSLFSTVVILVLFFKFGLPFMANTSMFLSRFGHPQETTSKKDSSVYIQPPLFNSVPSGTNSAQFALSGSAAPKQTINLYVNDSLEDKTTVGKDGTFSFDSITLTPGENKIKAKAENEDGKNSDFSDEFSVIYKNKAPSLTLDSPTDGQTYSKDDNSASFKGKTDPRVIVTINDFRAIVDDSGNFSYRLPLKNGENKVIIVATDEANNLTKLERKVTYNP